MSTFTLKVDTENAAFHQDTGDEWEHAPGPELVRILRSVADHIERGDEYEFFQTIHDAAGNDVGRFALKSKDYR